MLAITEEQFEAICCDIETTSFGLRRLCKNNGVAVSTFYRYLDETPENQERYARAKERQADILFDEIVEISDDSTNDLMNVIRGGEMQEQENKEFINRSRLRVDARKWVASKLNAKKYGDKIDVTSNGKSMPFVLTLTEPDEADGKAD